MFQLILQGCKYLLRKSDMAKDHAVWYFMVHNLKAFIINVR